MRKSNIFIEGQIYSRNQIDRIFKSGFEETLISKNVLIKTSAGIKFNFVGFISDGREDFFVIPKYYQKVKKNLSLINFYLRLLVKAEKDIEIEYPVNTDDYPFIDEGECSDILSILNHFQEYGIYKDNIYKKSSSYEHSVDWNRTIEINTPYIIGKNILYLDISSKYSRLNENDLITRLHSDILYYSFRKLGKYLKGLQVFDFPQEDILNRYDNSYLLHQIQKRLNETFVDYKIAQLNLIKSFIEKFNNYTNQNISVYGTTSFHLLWELACSRVFRNQYFKYKDYIPYPKWTVNSSNYFSKHRMKPDLLKRRRDLFFILDAKYYSIKTSDNLISGEPKTEDISKQLLYEMILRNKFSIPIYNAFILPDIENVTETSHIEQFSEDFIKGKVYYENTALNETIKLWFLPPKQLFSNYIDNISISLDNEYFELNN